MTDTGLFLLSSHDSYIVLLKGYYLPCHENTRFKCRNNGSDQSSDGENELNFGNSTDLLQLITLEFLFGCCVFLE